MIDAHCHLDFPVFDADRSAMLERARQAGVKGFVVPGVTQSTWARTLSVCQSYPDLFPCLGLHPYFLEEHSVAQLALLENMLKAHPEVVAIGEIGVDFWASNANSDLQWHLLDAQLLLAQQYRLPVVLHVRKGHDQVLKRLRQRSLPCGGLIHAFSGSLQQAQAYWSLGFHLGIGGAVTYDRAQKLRRVVQQLPLESILLETDSPDMPLSGYQGQRNEPARLALVLSVVAQLRGMQPHDLALSSEAMTRQLFQLP
ncbi:hypothetical protein BFW38_06770 [Terasakiispira papahanaumokuakeensis]|uniref:Hydrolase TatD n=1 Tax=Terasakiispira papahanaumokuakeensis TaxID=197479 RepID=A0A1E2V8P4_9GAMM|nr:TatD family hydrolase [Terasakiispira papahanaumokuakeensis]ODC03293.1 hypothetical protein BFW38_06770 [Terasakiispira papahanaumokuakeensis]